MSSGSRSGLNEFLDDSRARIRRESCLRECPGNRDLRGGRSLATFAFVVLFLVTASRSQALCPDFGLPDGSEIVELQTSQGQICIELLRAAAPTTVLNFQSYVVRGDYDGTIIHRSDPGFVIQGGAFAKTVDSLNEVVTDPPIPNEPCTIEPGDSACTVRSNVRGTVAMAKLGGQPNSATSQYFINLGDNSFLDSTNGGFTVFGNVLGAGMTVADDIVALSIADPDESWWLAPPFANALTEVPVMNPVPLFPTPFGCWDPTNLGVVVDPVNDLQGLPDPVFGTDLYPLSGDCGTQIPRGSFVQDPGPPGCSALDVLTTGVTGMNSLQIVIDPATQDFLQFEFTCPEVENALTQRELWRNDFGARLTPELVVIQAANYQLVPELALSATQVTAVLSLCVIAWSRRVRGSGPPH
jgi:cyclophilin family peptidyl-prolyl cis-trans isomerase